jgi:dTDP-4-dehydrorhamnose 3,5-epimerase
MTFKELSIDGIFEVNNFIAKDERGIFVKTFNKEVFVKNGFEVSFDESYYSLSTKNVIRGMHFQLPPLDHEKLVYVTDGEILDVVVDLRKESKTYGKYLTLNLKAFDSSIFISKGFAHGFLCLSETATVVYNVATGYNPQFDAGISWNSFGFDWNEVEQPVMSERDKNFVSFEGFKSPF